MINVRKFLRSKDKFSDCKSPSNRLKMMHVNLIMVRLNTNIGEKGWSKRFQREKTLFTKSESESCSVVSDSWWPHELIPPMEFSRPEYWSGYPFPSPGDFPNPEIEPRSPELQVDSWPAELQGKPKNSRVGTLSLLQWIFPTQELNWGLLHCRQILYQLSYQGSRV